MDDNVPKVGDILNLYIILFFSSCLCMQPVVRAVTMMDNFPLDKNILGCFPLNYKIELWLQKIM